MIQRRHLNAFSYYGELSNCARKILAVTFGETVLPFVRMAAYKQLEDLVLYEPDVVILTTHVAMSQENSH